MDMQILHYKYLVHDIFVLINYLQYTVQKNLTIQNVNFNLFTY